MSTLYESILFGYIYDKSLSYYTVLYIYLYYSNIIHKNNFDKKISLIGTFSFKNQSQV